MSYDLKIWEGETPSSHAELHRVLDRISEDMERRAGAGEPPDPPSPAIADFIQALLRRWPDSDDDSPWSAGGTGDADGSSLTVLIQWGREAEVSEFVAGLAKVHGLLCYDCQSARLRP